jgi:hypothetical protein
MPDDHIQQQMNFIVEQQAQFAADIQILKERQEANARQIEANSVSIRQLVDVTMSLARHVDETDQRWEARMKEIPEAGAHTDRRLGALIDTVDKLVRRNGGAA